MNVPSSPVITFEGVCKRYGRKDVLNDIDLQVFEGENLVLLGHNGAGKTTLMKIVLGLTRASAGKVRVMGEDPVVAASTVLRGRFGYLPEKVSLYENLSGREALRFYARLKGENFAACDDLLEQMGLAPAADRRIATYSKGMRQRLGLAQAILGSPRLLFLDEPTTGLDPTSRQDFYALLRDLRKSGVTMFLSSHALSEVEHQADRLVILREGRVVTSGTLDELRRRAGLPVRLRVSMAGDDGQVGVEGALGAADGNAQVTRINGHTIEVSCAQADKMETIRRILAADETIDNIELTPPGLEDIYRVFTEQGGPR
ncbi:ABC transporter ATP-binding protein [Varunaivibrio sulfuroxidans]|uniref:Cu-processing system ATP-binding protein n=1 Tax=Varunaivibrio sulfuroxidans TaxID=1773489 RepID=A0A4R3JGU3_9PROT|nr:ABC transporter ATP-binding protein [Varunaivibrio sulfuroxidans]TCS63990.1 Cu-processing system ATP-binding protein [Varunaivibrio sulfuroxidans]WES31557.1 ABC transporter ATP-binding protein [Varunaivibrio sulfuroxidans]